tara:strand:+ start:228 stop:416 length:189 start_codon:yes stop_codon:yes gene_type:complete
MGKFVSAEEYILFINPKQLFGSLQEKSSNKMLQITVKRLMRPAGSFLHRKIINASLTGKIFK